MKTRDLAAKLGKQPQTLHAAICRKGSYYGVRPKKLPDGSLLWPDDAVEQLLEYVRQHGAVDKAKRAREGRAAAQTASRPECVNLRRHGRPKHEKRSEVSGSGG